MDDTDAPPSSDNGQEHIPIDVDEPVDKDGDQGTEQTGDQATEQKAEHDAEQSTDQPADPPADQPADQAADQPAAGPSAPAAPRRVYNRKPKARRPGSILPADPQKSDGSIMSYTTAFVPGL